MSNTDWLREIIVNHTSEMLDNPGENDIYPTTKFYNNLEQEILAYIDEHYTPNSEIEKIKREAKKQGFYMAAGLFGVESPDKVEPLWDKCIAELSKEETDDQ